MSKKIQYTDGSLFLEEVGDEFKDYVGYFNTVNNIPYKTKYNQDLRLLPKKTLITDIVLSDEYFDRSIFDNLSLPYTEEDLTFAPNELINRNSINLKLELLYDNFLYIYRNTVFSNPQIPVNFSKYLALSSNPTSGNFITWFNTDTIFLSAEDLINKKLSSVNILYAPLSTNPGQPNVPSNIQIATFQNRNKNYYTVFTAISNTIFAYKASNDYSSYTFITSADRIGRYNDIVFNEITQIVKDGENILLINDTGNNVIYKTDVSSIVYEDRTGIRDFKFLASVGKKGKTKVNFDKIDKLAYGNNNIFIYDKIKYTITELTNDFGYIKTYKNERFFGQNEIADIQYNFAENYLYILTKNFKIIALDVNTFNKVKDYSLLQAFKYVSTKGGAPEIRDEIPLQIVFSKNNSNIYYVLTNKNIYKYFVNTQNKLISKFRIQENIYFVQVWGTTIQEPFSGSEVIYDTPSTKLTWDYFPEGDDFFFLSIDILDSESDYDRITIHGTDIILQFLENENEKSLLINKFPNFFKKDDLLLKDQFFNNLTYNYILYKHFYNNSLLLKNIDKRLFTRYIFQYDNLIFNNFQTQLLNDYFLTLKDVLFKDLYFYKFETIDPLTIDKIVIDQKNIYVGSNETINVNVFNRGIKKLLTYQKQIIPLLQTDQVNEEVPDRVVVTF